MDVVQEHPNYWRIQKQMPADDITGHARGYIVLLYILLSYDSMLPVSWDPVLPKYYGLVLCLKTGNLCDYTNVIWLLSEFASRIVLFF